MKSLREIHEHQQKQKKANEIVQLILRLDTKLDSCDAETLKLCITELDDILKVSKTALKTSIMEVLNAPSN